MICNAYAYEKCWKIKLNKLYTINTTEKSLNEFKGFFYNIPKKSPWNFDKLTCFENNIFVFYIVIKNMGDFNENKIWFDGENTSNYRKTK